MRAQAVAAQDVCIRSATGSALPLQRPHDRRHTLSGDSTTGRQDRASLWGCDTGRQTAALGAGLRGEEVEVEDYPAKRSTRTVVAACIRRSAVIDRRAETHGGMEAPLRARKSKVLEPLRCGLTGGSSTGRGPEICSGGRR